jgi:two-component system, sensor histidine kinase PdtaS
VSTLSDLLAEHTSLTPDDIDHLQRLVGEWQLLADLSFADLLLWAAVDGEFLCVAQVRPTTGPTAYQDDRVGTTATGQTAYALSVALGEERIFREADPDWHDGVPVRREALPVRHRGRIVALLGRDTNLAPARSPSQLELAYLQSAADLCQMVADGTFPPPGQHVEQHSGPRAGDGLLRLDPTGSVSYASPNALSAYRRMGVTGNLTDTALAPLTRSLVTDPFDGAEIADRIGRALAGEAPLRMEIEARGAVVLFRALPLRPRGEPLGALVLLRDMTEVARRDRQLMSKDATIREIHHRVKNNLQTVAALLRLQARRMGVPEARAALEESVRRVSSIALVHETLSLSPDERVAFDDIVDRLLSMVGDVAVVESRVTLRREGAFGVLSAEVATPLVMVLTELMQNAVEHAFPRGHTGSVVVAAQRTGRWLDVAVRDDGRGLPERFDLEASDRLGLQIVRTLVGTELRASLELRPRADGGTEAVIRIPMTRRQEPH